MATWTQVARIMSGIAQAERDKGERRWRVKKRLEGPAAELKKLLEGACASR